MKRLIASVLTLLLLLTFTVFYPQPTYGADAVTSATPATPAAPGAPAAPAAPVVTAPAAPVAAPVVAAPAAAPAATTVSAAGQLYVVVSGDMMWTIAKKFNVSVDQLIALNPQIKNPNLIYPGQNVVVKAAAQAAAAAATAGSVKVYQGFGQSLAFRNGPGKDDTGVAVYSFNIAMAQAMFDSEGRIMNVYIDGYEVATPNYDGASMPHFSGWPGKEGYNITDHETAKVTGVSVNTLESAVAEVTSWKTKRERGDSYHMNPANEWYKQMDFFQKFFVGKTVAELEVWFAKNTTAAGRPIKATTTKQDELDKLAKLTDKEKAELVDVVSGATMSIRDAHGDFLGAVAKAYQNRVEVVVPVK